LADRGGTQHLNEAANRFAETLADSYRLVYGQASESAERQQQRAREFSELVSSSLQEQTEAGRANAQQLSEQAAKQREAYAQFLDDAFAPYWAGTAPASPPAPPREPPPQFLTAPCAQSCAGPEQATQSAQAGGLALTEAAPGLLHTAAR